MMPELASALERKARRAGCAVPKPALRRMRFGMCRRVIHDVHGSACTGRSHDRHVQVGAAHIMMQRVAGQREPEGEGGQEACRRPSAHTLNWACACVSGTRAPRTASRIRNCRRNQSTGCCRPLDLMRSLLGTWHRN